MYYHVSYFRKRVPRVVLPPSKLYWRVRAVYEVYGNMLDGKTKKPLFNDAAWKKANGVLKDILAGFISDPPGFSFYQQQLNRQGEPAFDSLGIALLDCNRGTNDTECVHKQIMTTFGSWCTGVEMADCLMAEFRHRYNQNVSERRRFGFPKLGHYDTWLAHSLQILCERNHSVLIYPGLSNSSDYISTAERHGTAPLQSDELTLAINLKVPAPTCKFTSDQKYLCKAMGTTFPLLPMHGKAELKLFQELYISMPSPVDFAAMALEWIKHINGVDIFPKLPVYLRTHFTSWQRNQRVRDAVRSAASGKERLNAINAATVGMPVASSTAGDDQPGPSTTRQVPVPIAPSVESTGAAATETAGLSSQACPASTIVDSGITFAAPVVEQHPTMPQPPLGMPLPFNFPPIVGGTVIGGAPANDLSGRKPRGLKRGMRSSDRTKRKDRAETPCKRCVEHGDAENARTCKGRFPNGKKSCIYYSQE